MIGSVGAINSQLNRLAGLARRLPVDRMVVDPTSAVHPDSRRGEADNASDDSRRPNRRVAPYLRQQEAGTHCIPPSAEPEHLFDSYA